MEEYENEMSEWEEESPEIRRLRQAEMPKNLSLKMKMNTLMSGLTLKKLQLKKSLKILQIYKCKCTFSKYYLYNL